jgi:CubicO group peptidase (beta-lactamase class C family)
MTVKNCLFKILVIGVLGCPLWSAAQTIQLSGKPNADISIPRLQRIDTLVNDYLEKGYENGVVTLVVKDGQVAQYKSYGYANAERKVPMPKDAIFRIASQTKAITSIGIMMLYEQGRLLLDEPISDFIPEFKNTRVLAAFNAKDTTFTTVPAKRQITFRDLLTHSSGIDYADIGSPTGRAIYAKAGIPVGLGNIDASLLQKMKVLAAQPLMFQPGERFQYSLSVDLLGCLIEVISGTTLDEFFRKNIFAPIGMNDTYFTVPASKANRLATVYTEDEQHRLVAWNHTLQGIDPDYPLAQKHYFSGGAGLSSTAFDYAKLMQMMLNDGVYNGKRILSARSVQLMTSSQLDFTHNGWDNFGLGFSITTPRAAARNARTEGTFGWGGYFGTTYFADPKNHLVVLIMTQHTPNSHGDLSNKIEALIYSSLIKVN